MISFKNLNKSLTKAKKPFIIITIAGLAITAIIAKPKIAKDIIGYIIEYDKDGIPNITWFTDAADLPAWTKYFFNY